MPGGAGDPVTDAPISRTELDPLIKVDFETHNMKWEDYVRVVRAENAPLLDCIVNDPPYGVPRNRKNTGTGYQDVLSSAEVLGVVSFAKRILKPGRYSLTFCSHRSSIMWLDAFEDADFLVSDPPIVIMKRNKARRERRHVPQNHLEYLVVARKPGESAGGWEPKFDGVYERSAPGSQTRLNPIQGIETTRNMLLWEGTKAPVRE